MHFSLNTAVNFVHHVHHTRLPCRWKMKNDENATISWRYLLILKKKKRNFPICEVFYVNSRHSIWTNNHPRHLFPASCSWEIFQKIYSKSFSSWQNENFRYNLNFFPVSFFYITIWHKTYSMFLVTIHKVKCWKFWRSP